METEIYITKDETGLIQLWENKPIWNKKGQCYMRLNEARDNNEIGIDITNNAKIRNLFSRKSKSHCGITLVITR